MKKRMHQLLLFFYKLCFLLLGKILPKNKKVVIFESFHGKQYSDNPRAIYEYMKEHFPNYTLIWSADRRYTSLFRKRQIYYVPRLSIKWLWTMNRAGYWIVNTRLPLWLPKSNKVKYVQTWHGTPLKRLATDMDQVLMPGTDTGRYKRNFLYEASKWDYLVSPNAYSTEIFKRAFGFDKQVIESGYPRNDYLITHNNNEEINKLKSKMGLPLDKKVILYAPTWRDNQFYRKGQYKFELKINLSQLKRELGNEYVILLRMHYLVAEHLDITAYKDFVYDYSTYEDIRDLYLISDILITDYSSVFFDYANLKRPILFFVDDIDDYRDNLRGFYFNLEEEAPGPLLKNTNELVAAINDSDNNYDLSGENKTNFYKQFCYLEDGGASQRVVSSIFDN